MVIVHCNSSSFTFMLVAVILGKFLLSDGCTWIPGNVDPIYTTADNTVQVSGLWHDQTSKYFTFSNPSYKSKSVVEITIRVLKGDITSCNIKYFESNNPNKAIWSSMLKRSILDTTDYFEYWTTYIAASSYSKQYRFQVNDGFDTIWYDQCGPHSDKDEGEPSGDQDFQFDPKYDPPSWVNTAIYYQILPDRFNDGDSTNNRLHTPRDSMFDYAPRYPSWSTLPENPSLGRDFFGGDLVGIENKLDYIQDLGVNTIYMNPVFKASSNHRYDGIDFFSVDDSLGGDSALESLLANAHSRGIRVILDAALTGVSSDSPWFDKYAHYDDSMGAFDGGKQRAASSPYSDRFIFDSRSTCEYYAWGDNCDFPLMNYNSTSLIEDTITGSDSMLKHWLKRPYNIDGWRFDSVQYFFNVDTKGNLIDQAEHAVMEKAYQEIKNNYGSDRIIIGELNFRQSDKSYLAGDQMDGVHNYNGFTIPMIEYVWGTKASEFLAWIWGVLADNSHFKNLNKWNHISTHDVLRFLTVAQSGWLYEGTILQMTMVGSPMIYYGDEIGMEGGDDPDNRRTFNWNESEWRSDYRSFVKSLVQLRNNYTALQSGGFFPLTVHDNLNYLSFARTAPTSEDESVFVILNSNHATNTISVPVWLLSIPDGTVLQNRVPKADHSKDDNIEDWRKDCYENMVENELFTVRNGKVEVTVCGEFGAVLTLQNANLAVGSDVIDSTVTAIFSIVFTATFFLSICISVRS